jgi:two-component system, chemotaxis family, sensor kinase CheA
MTNSTGVMEEMRRAFRSEAQDLLVELDSALLDLEAEPGDLSLVHRVFRSIHTIKGSGGTAGCARLARFAHNMEEAFDLAREGRLSVTADLIDCGLKACDILRLILDAKSEGVVIPGEVEVTDALARLLPVRQDAPERQRVEAKSPSRPRAAFEIIFKPTREIFYSGTDPVTLLDDLRELGQAHISAHVDQVPNLPSLEAEHCYLWWDILLVTDRDDTAIREVFVFVEDECDVSIRLMENQDEEVALIGSIPAEMFELFILECEEHLEKIDLDALALESDPLSRGNLDSLFRSVHSIKGNAGLLLDQVSGGCLTTAHPLRLLLRVAHGLESLLDTFRGVNADPVSDETARTVLETCDAIRGLLGRMTHKKEGATISADLLERLGVHIGSPPEVHTVDGRQAAFLNTTSQCIEMIAGCFLRMDDDLDAAKDVAEAYLRGLTTLSAAAKYKGCQELEQSLAQQLQIVGRVVQSGGVLEEGELSELHAAFQTVRSVVDRISQDEDGLKAPDFTTDMRRPAKIAEQSAASAVPSTIRIDQNKLDALMRVVGELLVARGALPLLIQKLNDGAERGAIAKDMKDAGSNISRIAEELQSSVMSIRMLPVKTVFQRFPRLVRDLARSLGKEVRLVVEGEGIELDKTILEQIGDPLVHVIRNAVDHGLEPPAERIAQGKEAAGQLTLRAVNEAGGVRIEVTDDGRGLNSEALKRKAVEKGLLTQEAADAMTEEAAFQLVFMPGLTTAAKVTDVSGRGVGMDVVHSNVRNLQGTTEIRSKRGRGTSFLIRLPTSLMVSKGILLEAGAQEYILPLGNIRDMVKLPSEEAHKYGGQALTQVRGTIYPIFNLAQLFGLTPADTPDLSIAIVDAGAMKYGLVVDRFLTEVEVLVKPLSAGLERCREFQGSAIMGDGRVVLVLNALECHNLDRTT